MKCPKCSAFLFKNGSQFKDDERYLRVGGHSFFWGSREYNAIEAQRIKIMRRLGQ